MNNSNKSDGNPFVLPLRNAPASGDEQFQPRPFQAWVESLPTGNLGQTAQLVYQRLKLLNRTEVPGADRLRFMDQLSGPLDFVIDGLTARVQASHLPLGKRESKLARLNLALLTLAVKGYKATLEQFHHDSIGGRLMHRNARQTALHRMIHYMGRTFQSRYQIYRRPPAYLWKELHGVYHYAVENELQDKVVEGLDKSRSTVNDLYRCQLLLSLANPYHMMRGEVDRVARVLMDWAPLCRLIPFEDADEQSGVFLVDAASDLPPRYRGIGDDSQVSRGWVIDTSALEPVMRQLFEQLHQQEGQGAARPLAPGGELSADLVARLMLSLGIGLQRMEDRVPGQGEALVTCGLDALYTILGGDWPQSADQPGFKLRTVADASPATPDDAVRLAHDEFVIDGGADLASLAGLDGDMKLEQPAPIFDESPELAIECTKNCGLYNESRRGFLFHWRGSADNRAQVGELVGVQRRGNGVLGNLKIGVLRWLREEPPGAIDFGVELLSEEAKPLELRRTNTRSGKSDRWGALLLRNLDGGFSLITPPFYGAPDDRFLLVQEQQEELLDLGRPVEQSPSFMQFNLNVVSDEGGDEDVSEEGLVADENNFEELWSNL